VVITITLLWMAGIGWVTWRIVHEGRTRNVSVSLIPIQIFQAVLIIMTLVSFVVHRDTDWNTLSTILLAWEVWCALFTVTFLGLALLMGKRLKALTWLTNIGVVAWIFYALWRRI
jgi:hypothetical protein